MSIGASVGAGVVEQGDLVVQFLAGVTFDFLEARQYKESEHFLDHFRPTREEFAGSLRFSSEAAGTNSQVRLAGFSLSSGGGNFFLARLDLDSRLSLVRMRLFNLGLLDSSTYETLGRFIRVRAVFFKDPCSGRVTGARWGEQRDAAIMIWKKCCIDIVECQPPLVLCGDIVRRARDLFDVAFSYFGRPGTIHVFFVDKRFGGGGWTIGDGAAHARCVLTDYIEGNTNLLAHELGHVFDGDHPGTLGPTTGWSGDRRTILEDNGSTTVPNPERNTLRNCMLAKNDAMETSQICMLKPDPPL